jgi:hypothetical protein
MAGIKSYVTASVVFLASQAMAAEPVALREAVKPGATTRVQVQLKAEGLFLQAAPPGTAKKDIPKPLTLKVEVRLDYFDRLLAIDPAGRPGRSARRVIRAGSAVNGEIRPFATAIRPEAAVLTADAKGDSITIYSPLTPLTRSELELLEEPADPLSLFALLPEKPVSPGDRWTVGLAAARSLSSYDSIQDNKFEGTLETVEPGSARVKLTGEVRGSRLGGEGTIRFEGAFTFDRKLERVNHLTLQRSETRRPGMVEEGLDVKSTLTVIRDAAEPPPELKDGAIDRLNVAPDAANLALLYQSPDDQYTLRHGRGWHIYWDSPKLTVLKRVEGDRLIAQCNLSAGPSAGRGNHQDPDKFRDDIKKSLGDRFVQLIGAGELEGDPAGGYRYKVGVQGKQGDIGVVWYYYVMASPDGEQILATFTLADTVAKLFGDEDEALIGTFRWKNRTDGKASR